MWRKNQVDSQILQRKSTSVLNSGTSAGQNAWSRKPNLWMFQVHGEMEIWISSGKGISQLPMGRRAEMIPSGRWLSIRRTHLCVWICYVFTMCHPFTKQDKAVWWRPPMCHHVISCLSMFCGSTVQANLSFWAPNDVETTRTPREAPQKDAWTDDIILAL